MAATELLTPELLIAAYAAGYFPMADMRSARRRAQPTIAWYAPDPRAILPLEEGAMHISRSLACTIRRATFEISTDHCFEQVMRECASPRRGDEAGGAWISGEMIQAYTELHRLGHAHSVEAWCGAACQRRLVGGIYGVSIGAAFFAESMFCRPELGGTDASKVCLVDLVNRLRRMGYQLLDVQIANPHTMQFGVIEIDRTEFERRLADAVRNTPAVWC